MRIDRPVLTSLLLALVAGGQGFAAAPIYPTAIVDVTGDGEEFDSSPITGGRPHDQGETRWTDVLEQRAGDFCAPAVKDCVRSQIRIRNDSARPIQCRLVAEKWPQEDGTRGTLTLDRVIFPGGTMLLARSDAAKARSVQRFATNCRIYDADYQPLAVPTACQFKLIEVPNPDDFYPPSSKRRSETGSVVIEASLKRRSQEFEDIRIAQSSGYEGLDNAALRVAQGARGESRCPKQRYRFRIRFVIQVRD